MENGQSMNNALGRENGFLMEPLDQRDHAISNDYIMSRRLKNRERQRRYRARKRLEADTKKARTMNNSTSMQVEMQVSGIPNNFVTKTHCQRNWKKDARRAHALVTGLTSVNESQLTLLPSGVGAKSPTESGFDSKDSPAPDNSGRRVTPGRRHWKADARNKKN